METNTKILLYDDYCPLCSWYSGIFVKLGLLDKENRVPFSKAGPGILTSIDIEKGKDEIPLFDPHTHQTLYGIDALLEILGKKCSIIKTIGNIKPVNWFLKKLYKFISYNRKVIVAKKCGAGSFDCSPGFNIPYRVLFMVLFLVINSLMLFPLHQHLFSQLSVYHLTAIELQLAHFGLVTVNFTIASSLRKKERIEYLGQVNMLAIIAILLLVVIMFVNKILPVPEWLIITGLAIITVFISREYFRRMRYANVLGKYKRIIAVNLFCLIVFLGYVFH